MDEKVIREIAGQLGLSGAGGVSAQEVRRLEQQSDAELSAQILQMREQLARKGVSYDKQMAMVRNLMPMMDGRQRARLQKILTMLQR